jgi:CheY-like chemotaxis protein
MNSKGPVLLVEDSDLDAELTIEAFAESKLANDIIHVKDGVEALDYLFKRGPYANNTGERPIVVLLDLKMPRVDGFEVLKEVKGNKATKDIPVVIMTSSKVETDLSKCYDLGANGYVVKPVDSCEFLEVIKRVGLYWIVTNQPSPK